MRTRMDKAFELRQCFFCSKYRTGRAGLLTLSSIPIQEQYHFCYDIALEYLESLETR